MNPLRLIFSACLAASLGLAAHAQCRFPEKGSGRVLTYSFQPEIAGDSMTMHVTLQFQGGAAGGEEFLVPKHWAGEELHDIVNLRALSPGASVTGNESEGSRPVRHPPNQPVTLAYDVVKDWTGPFRHPLQFHGAVTPEYLEINGDNGLVHPKLEPQSKVTVNFDWQKLPSGWALATSFGAGMEADGRCQSYSGEWRMVREALFAAGDFRLHRFQIADRPAVLAIRSKWTFTDEQAIADIQKVVAVVRDFWRDHNFPYFLVTLKPYDTDHGSGDGSGFTNAFWLYMSRLDPFSTQLTQLSHEAFHAWNPRKMGIPQTSGGSIDWFHEGFTRYYADLLVYRAGLMPLAKYLESTNIDLRTFPDSTSPYVRGRVIALWVDQQIRKESENQRSLDNLMFDMVKESDKPLSNSRILETAARYLSAESRRVFDQTLAKGSPVPPMAALGPCAPVSLDEVALFDVGFDFPASRNTHIMTAVKPDGPAYRAGLRNGQPLLSWSVNSNQPDKLARLTVEIEGERKAIEYYPRNGTVSVPQYHLDEAAYASNPESCRLR